MESNLNELSAGELHARYKNRTLTPVDVTRAVLERIALCEPRLHATYALDAEAALEAARQSERRWQAQIPQGPLDGVPVTLKENIATRGVPVPLGSAATVLKPAAEDAPVAARLREAGAIIVTKTVMPDFGFLAAAPSSFHPLVRNPWDTSKNTGGSSSGAGAAAAAGYGPLHVGTDIGGSIRIPSSFCGVFGLKPSQGRVPVAPPYAGRCAGPMTRTVSDAALMMQVLSLSDGRDYSSLPYQAIDWQRLGRDLKGLRIGLFIEPAMPIQLDPEVKSAVVNAARAFEAAGAIVEPLTDWSTYEMRLGFVQSFAMRSRTDLAAMPEERRALAAPVLHQLAAFAATLSHDEVFQSFAQMQAMRAATVAATQPYDFVLSPVSPCLPFEAEATSSNASMPGRDVYFTNPFNMSEQPAASVNCGHSKSGLPIGLQIVGRRFDDLGVLQMARAWEEMRPAQTPWPTVT